ncbi:MAG: hypothetical protein ACTSP4_09175 [Candidatus Hodarchaeales archaeon]
MDNYISTKKGVNNCWKTGNTREKCPAGQALLNAGLQYRDLEKRSFLPQPGRSTLREEGSETILDNKIRLK